MRLVSAIGNLLVAYGSAPAQKGNRSIADRLGTACAVAALGLFDELADVRQVGVVPRVRVEVLPPGPDHPGHGFRTRARLLAVGDTQVLEDGGRRGRVAAGEGLE